VACPNDHAKLRASDADRERVAGALREAASLGQITPTELNERLTTCYAAKTIGDLLVLTEDLPGHAATLAPPQPVTSHAGGKPGPATSVGIFGGFERRGRWVVPAEHTAVAMMGGGYLDLREASFAATETTITVFAFFGGVDIVVPAGIAVHVSGMGIMGGFDHDGPQDAAPGAPVVRVEGLVVMGGVSVKQVPQQGKRLTA
jgi:hypothetical protein